jgi:alpha-L-fucosidase
VQQVLLAVGGWLKVNGDAIYGARQWKVYGEGPTKVAAGSFHDTETRPYTAEDFRFTTKGPVLFAIELAWPTSGEAVIRSLGTSYLEGGSYPGHLSAWLGREARLSATG